MHYWCVNSGLEPLAIYISETGIRRCNCFVLDSVQAKIPVVEVIGGVDNKNVDALAQGQAISHVSGSDPANESTSPRFHVSHACRRTAETQYFD